MLFRLIATACVFGVGYYLGKEIGRTESIREELERTRRLREEETKETAGKGDDPVT